ncbi:MAG: hypothetical protein ACI9R3_006067 [Verrucomicrobiales bacterium]
MIPLFQWKIDNFTGRFGRAKRHFEIEALPDQEKQVKGRFRISHSINHNPTSLMTAAEYEAQSFSGSQIYSGRDVPEQFAHLISFD